MVKESEKKGNEAIRKEAIKKIAERVRKIILNCNSLQEVIGALQLSTHTLSHAILFDNN